MVNWKDCQGWRDDDLTMSTTSNEAAKMYDAALTQVFSWELDGSVGNYEGAVDKMHQADPNFVMGRVLTVGMDMIGTGRTTRIDQHFKQEVNDLVTLAKKHHVTEREAKHVAAVKLWSQGEMNAASYIWEDILVDHPLDALAVRFNHDTFIYTGQQRRERDAIARVLPFWKESHPLYSYLLGMYSFALVETNLLKDAEEVAKKALAMNPKDAESTHSLAHVYEIGGRAAEGIALMSSTVSSWSGEFSGALDIYDGQIGSRTLKTGVIYDVVDASATLFRLELEGVDPGVKRWNDLYEVIRPHLDDHILVFNDMHYLMACLGARRTDAAEAFMTSLKKYVESASGDNQTLSKEVGLPMAEAIIACNSGDYERTVELLNPIRHKVKDIGASDAQRDIFSLLLLHAALKSSQPKHKKLVRQLLHEREIFRRGSSMTERMMARAQLAHED